MGPVKRVEFSYPRSDLTHPDSGVSRLSGNYIVWSYAQIRHNIRARSMPLVDVYFRSLKKNVPSAGQFVSLPLSSIPHYRIGTIWRRGKCVSDTLMQKRKFDVDFSPEGWSLTSRLELNQMGMGHIFADEDYPLHYGERDSMKLINFKLPKGNLLVSCVDYFARAYARNMDVCRALTTLRWSDVMDVLYEDPRPSAHQWLVKPSRRMRNYDAVYLAHLMYDSYTEMRTKKINSQFASRSPLQKVNLQAEPWFTGPGKLECRGKWINGGKTFLCLDLVGSSEPIGEDIQWQALKFDSTDGKEGAGRLVMPRPLRSAHAEEFLQEHSYVEPDKHSEITIVKAPPFKALGKKRKVVKTKKIVPTDKGRLGPNPPRSDSLADGDGVGSGKNVGKSEHVAEAKLESHGFLRDIWNAFASLKKCEQNNITRLDWYTPTDGFSSSEPAKVLVLAPIENSKIPSDVRSWVYLDRGTNQLRGLLVLRIQIAGVDYFCFETQRKEIEGDQSSRRAGLLMKSHVSSEEEFSQFVEKLSSTIRYKKGVFKNMANVFPPGFETFNHTQKDKQVLYRNRLIGAFRKLGVELV